MYIVQNYKEIWKSTDCGDNWSLFKNFSKSANNIVISITDTSIIYCGADDTFYKSINSGADWFKVIETNETFFPITIVNPYNKNSLFLQYHQIYKSINGGKTATPILNQSINTFALNPKDTLTLYASHGDPVFTPEGGIIKTTDGGENWFSVVNGIPGSYVTANKIAINPQNPEELYAAIGDLGVFKTINGGENWSLSRLSNAQVFNIFIDESFPAGTLISSQYGWGLMKTTDNGKTWHQPEFDTEFQQLVIYDMTFKPNDKQIGYCGAKFGLYKTIDGGETWNLYTNQLDLVYEIAYHPLNSFVVFASGGHTIPPSFGKLYKSDDSGENWEMVLETMQDGVISFVFHHSDPNIIYAQFGAGIRKSIDGGQTWVEKNEGLLGNGYTFDGVLSLEMSKSNPNILYCSQDSQQGGLFVSRNAGENWEQIDSVLFEYTDYVRPSSILLDETNNDRIYVGLLDGGQPQTSTFHNGGLFLTEDAGKHWRKIYDGQVNVVKSDNSTPKNIYFGTKFGIMTIVDTFQVTDVEENITTISTEFKLYQNYPNPFNPSTTISYSIPGNVKSETANVKLDVYDILGNKVATLVNKLQTEGNYKIKFDASNFASGIYLYKLNYGSFMQTKKMLLIK